MESVIFTQTAISLQLKIADKLHEKCITEHLGLSYFFSFLWHFYTWIKKVQGLNKVFNLASCLVAQLTSISNKSELIKLCLSVWGTGNCNGGNLQSTASLTVIKPIPGDT